MSPPSKITPQSSISIVLTVALVVATWNLSAAAHDLRSEMDGKYVSQDVASLRFQRVDEKLDDILKQVEDNGERIKTLEADR